MALILKGFLTQILVCLEQKDTFLPRLNATRQKSFIHDHLLFTRVAKSTLPLLATAFRLETGQGVRQGGPEFEIGV